MADRLVIVSGKGGAGKSTAAVLLGRSLAASGKKVLLVDADVGLNALGILTGAAENVVYHWGDALAGRCRAQDCVATCSDGLHLLLAPTAPAPELTAEGFAQLVLSFNASYDYIFIDGPAGIGAGMELAAAPAEKALLLSAPDDVSVSGCAKAAQRVCTCGPKQARLIINRFRFKAVKKCRQINIDSMIDRAGVRLIGIVPEDKNLWYFGSCGLLPKRESPAIAAYARIAGRLQGQNILLNPYLLK